MFLNLNSTIAQSKKQLKGSASVDANFPENDSTHQMVEAAIDFSNFDRTGSWEKNSSNNPKRQPWPSD